WRPRSMRTGQALADRFVLERLAGSGGMGEVYRALDQRTGQAGAVKIMRRAQGHAALRFEREARLLAPLDHPLIVRHLAHCAPPSGEPHLAMAGLPGRDFS